MYNYNIIIKVNYYIIYYLNLFIYSYIVNILIAHTFTHITANGHSDILICGKQNKCSQISKTMIKLL